MAPPQVAVVAPSGFSGQLLINYDIDTLVADPDWLAEALQIAALWHGRSGFRDSGAYHDFIGESG